MKNNYIDAKHYDNAVEELHRSLLTYRELNLWHLLCMQLLENRAEIEQKAALMLKEHGSALAALKNLRELREKI